MKILGIEFRTEFKYLLHLALIVGAIILLFHRLEIHEVHASINNILFLYLVIYISDNVWGDRLGV